MCLSVCVFYRSYLEDIQAYLDTDVNYQEGVYSHRPPSMNKFHSKPRVRQREEDEKIKLERGKKTDEKS